MRKIGLPHGTPDDMAAILSHYAPEVRLTSPAAARILNDPSGTVTGKEALSNYFRRGLEAYPNLRFELVDVLLRHFHRFCTLHLHCAVSPTPCWSRRLKFRGMVQTICENAMGLSSVVLYYINQKGTRTGEYMEFDSKGKVLWVVANYSL